MKSHYLTIGPVAEQVGLPRWKLAYLIERGVMPGPSVCVPGRRLFSDADIAQIRAAIAAQTLDTPVDPTQEAVTPHVTDPAESVQSKNHNPHRPNHKDVHHVPDA